MLETAISLKQVLQKSLKGELMQKASKEEDEDAYAKEAERETKNEGKRKKDKGMKEYK